VRWASPHPWSSRPRLRQQPRTAAGTGPARPRFQRRSTARRR
jgi:hypothetical protein